MMTALLFQQKLTEYVDDIEVLSFSFFHSLCFFCVVNDKMKMDFYFFFIFLG